MGAIDKQSMKSLIKESLKKVKKNYLNSQAFAGVVVIVLMFCAFLLYNGAAYNPPATLNNVKFGVLNLDAGFQLGPSVIRASAAFMYIVQNVEPLSSFLDWKFYNASTTSLDEFIKEVEDGYVWGGFVIPPTYSSTIFEDHGNDTTVDLLLEKTVEFYNPVHYPIDYYYDEGRNYNMHSILNKTVTNILTKMSLGIPGAFVSNLPAPYNTMVDPYFLMYPLNVSPKNLHPVNYSGVNFMSYIFAIVTYIAGMGVATLMAMTQPPPEEKRDLSSDLALNIFRFGFVVIFNLLYSLFIVFGYFVYNQHHNSGLFFLWVWLWLTCVECIMLLFVTLLTATKFSLIASLFLILQLSSGGAFVAEELSESIFYYIGHGLPFYYAVRGARYIFFGSLKNKMGENVGVIIAWTVATFLLAVLVILLKRRAHHKQVVGAHLQKEERSESISV